jgi:2-dehydro-3-deoxyphosphooctonate aldolase (KDO 8-P synthase)
MKKITINNIEVSNDSQLVLIAGPCQIESLNHAIDIAGKIDEISKKLQIGFIYKSSFDKANRTSITGRRGIGLDQSLNIFSEIKKHIGCPIITDIHESYQAEIVSQYVDILQIPALLSRQTDLIVSAAMTNKCVNIKKGQFLAPHDIYNAIEKCIAAGNENVMVTERGTCFGYNTLVNDMKGLQIMKDTKYPVIFDVTHSVQQPGGLATSSGGQRQFIETLARAAVAIGVAGLFIETHQDPDNAPSDGKCMLPLDNLEQLLERMKEFDLLSKKYKYLSIK